MIDDQPSLLTANQIIGLLPQRRFQRRAVPDAGANEMVQPVVADLLYARRHGLDALAITGANQAGNIGRTHSAPCLVTETPQIRREPTLQIVLPISIHIQPPSKLAPHESRIERWGNPKNQTFAKVVLAIRCTFIKRAPSKWDEY